MRLIYGSIAIKYWFPDFNREPKDLDIITDEVHDNEKGTEFYWIEEFNLIKNKDDIYLDSDYLYTIKLSHLSYDINWNKHYKDIIFLKSKGCRVIKDFYYELMKAWKRIHGGKQINLNVSNEKFFKENIKRVYDHDWLHEQFSLNGRPMNERIREDLNSPKCSEGLWNKLSHKEKIDCVIEELYVLTCERHIFGKSKNNAELFERKELNYLKFLTLKSMIIGMTSGWFNLFIKDNLKEILEYEPEKIMKKIKELNS